jgi:hypothetical protein
MLDYFRELDERKYQEVALILESSGKFPSLKEGIGPRFGSDFPNGLLAFPPSECRYLYHVCWLKAFLGMHHLYKRNEM